ncbi:MAG: hypothetical protein AAFX99_08650 [Myxococcota bacterium]
MTHATSEALLDLMEEHLERYPDMEPVDLYKLAHQAVLGVGHLVTTEEAAIESLLTEIDAMDPHLRDWEEPAELIHPERQLARIHLRPYLRAGGDVRVLAQAMKRTAEQVDLADLASLAALLGAIRPRLREHHPDFDVVGFDRLLRDLATEAFPARSHSEAYSDLYDPHYRVVIMDAFEEVSSAHNEPQAP